MPRTPTLPPTERVMWRRLLARVYPDAGGDHELFICTEAVRNLVCGESTVVEPFTSARNSARPGPAPIGAMVC